MCTRLLQLPANPKRSFFLVDVLETENVGAVFEGKVTYHESCHLLRSLRCLPECVPGVSQNPRALRHRGRMVENVDRFCLP